LAIWAIDSILLFATHVQWKWDMQTLNFNSNYYDTIKTGSISFDAIDASLLIANGRKSAKKASTATITAITKVMANMIRTL